MNISGYVNSKDFEASLKGLQKDLKKEVKREMKRSAEVVVNKAKELAPVDTAHLQKRIRSREAAWSKTNRVVYEIVSDATQNVSSAGPYPSFQEFGWMQSNGVFNPGHPYLRPALRQSAKEVQRIIKNAVMIALSRGGGISKTNATFEDINYTVFE